MKPTQIKKKVSLTKKRVYCRHNWEFRSHFDFRDGEYHVCRKCGKVKFN